MAKYLLFVVLNGVFCAIVYVLYREGLVLEAWEHDIMYIIPAITLTALFGLVRLPFSIATAEWCAETCVALGLLGTALGIWQAFSGIDPEMVGDINAIGQVLGVLLSGLGAALWTTMTGVFLNIWLTANIRLEEGT